MHSFPGFCIRVDTGIAGPLSGAPAASNQALRGNSTALALPTLPAGGGPVVRKLQNMENPSKIKGKSSYPSLAVLETAVLLTSASMYGDGRAMANGKDGNVLTADQKDKMDLEAYGIAAGKTMFGFAKDGSLGVPVQLAVMALDGYFGWSEEWEGPSEVDMPPGIS